MYGIFFWKLYFYNISSYMHIFFIYTYSIADYSCLYFLFLLTKFIYVLIWFYNSYFLLLYLIQKQCKKILDVVYFAEQISYLRTPKHVLDIDTQNLLVSWTKSKTWVKLKRSRLIWLYPKENKTKINKYRLQTRSIFTNL